jgi:hypothetical protein
MFLKRAIAGTTLTAMLALAVPAAPALADGAASTRNILFGLGAATYLIIQHNRKVHERYAEDARRQAELQSEKNDAWAAYSSEKRAYDNSLAEITDLKREVAYQHNIILQQRHQLAVTQRNTSYVGQERTAAPTRVAYAPPVRRAPKPQHVQAQRIAAATRSNDVAMVSYGWGTL